MPYCCPVSISCVYTCKANWNDTTSDGTSAYTELPPTEVHKENTK